MEAHSCRLAALTGSHSPPDRPWSPELPICDPHHHLWELRPEPVPYQRYLLSDLAADIHSGHHVRSTVFIEVKARYRTDGPEEMRPVGEVRFVEALATEDAPVGHMVVPR